MGLTGSSDSESGTEDWSLLGVSGYEAMAELTEVHLVLLSCVCVEKRASLVSSACHWHLRNLCAMSIALSAFAVQPLGG